MRNTRRCRRSFVTRLCCMGNFNFLLDYLFVAMHSRASAGVMTPQQPQQQPHVGTQRHANAASPHHCTGRTTRCSSGVKPSSAHTASSSYSTAGALSAPQQPPHPHAHVRQERVPQASPCTHFHTILDLDGRGFRITL